MQEERDQMQSEIEELTNERDMLCVENKQSQSLLQHTDNMLQEKLERVSEERNLLKMQSEQYK